MATARNSRPSPERWPARVTAPTLAEALQKARATFGVDACVVDSRAVTVREEEGLGSRRLIEVLVAPPGSGGAAPARPARAPAPGGDLAAALAGEVERIEQLVATLAGARGEDRALAGYPLAGLLQRAGASRPAVERAAARFARQPAADAGDAEAAVAHLRGLLRASASDWRQLGGAHVFLGDAGCGRTDLVLGAAARLRAAGVRTLVLALMPRHGGEIRRLQVEAAEHGYDAAVMHRPEQLLRNAARLDAYGAVLVDTPALFSAPLRDAGELQAFVAESTTLHRHLVVPADMDLREGGELWEAARAWNCDWTAVTRLDRTSRPGRLLDLAGRLPYPFSFVAAGAWPGTAPELARAEALVGRIVAAGGGLAAAARA